MFIRKYSAASVLAFAALITYTHHTYTQFFDAAIFLTTVKLPMIVMVNTGVVVAVWIYMSLVRLFMGTLRDSEITNAETRFYQHLFHVLLIAIFSHLAVSTVMGYILVADLLMMVLVAITSKRVDYIRAEHAQALFPMIRLFAFKCMLLVLNVGFSFYYIKQYSNAELKYLFALEHIMFFTELLFALMMLMVLMADAMCCQRRVWEGKNNMLSLLELLSEVILVSL
jgi:hypothetical protein